MIDLREYGLNAYESAAFLALVQEGASTAHVLAKESGVPYGKIYPVLASLEEKGFVKVFAGPPKKFIAVDPKIALADAMRKKEKELSRLKNKTEKIVEHLGAFAARKSEEPLESIRVIDGFDTYLDLSVELHNKTKQEWCSITDLGIYKRHFDATANCIKRGVIVKLLTFPEEKNKKNLDLWKKIGAEVRFTDYTPTQFSIIDGKEATIRIAGEERYIAVWLRNKAFAQHARNYFNILWKKATD